MLLLKLGTGLLSALAMLVTSGIPAGTALPVVLNSTLDAKKDKPGQKIDARLMQDIPLGAGEKIKAGARVTGHIVEVSRAGGGYRVVVKFDQLQDRGTTIPLNVSARAIATSQSVYSAQIPIDPYSNSEPQSMWVMRQVGGDVVNRGRGGIASGDSMVGRYDDGATWGKLTSSVQGDCTAADGNGIEQALWVFSTSACGLYGLEDVKLAHDGRTDPVGQIILESGKSIRVGGGSGWFLLVNAAAPATH
jgi:hypothetical protein